MRRTYSVVGDEDDSFTNESGQLSQGEKEQSVQLTQEETEQSVKAAQDKKQHK